MIDFEGKCLLSATALVTSQSRQRLPSEEKKMIYEAHKFILSGSAIKCPDCGSSNHTQQDLPTLPDGRFSAFAPDSEWYTCRRFGTANDRGCGHRFRVVEGGAR